MKKKKLRCTTILMLCLLGCGVLPDILAWSANGFADWYRRYIFHYLGSLYSRITGIFPFSVGEFMILAAVLWIPALAVMLLLLLRPACRPYCRRFFRATAWFVTIVFTLLSLNCFVLYQASGYKVARYSDGTLAAADAQEGSYTHERLASLRDYLVDKCNTLAEEVPRDANGEVIFAGIANTEAEDSDASGNSSGSASSGNSSGSASSGSGSGSEARLVSAEVRSAIAEEVITCMHSLAEDYPLLAGCYPHPKAMIASALMSQMNMEGYYFPFSMEANYNKYMTVCNYAHCMAHELSHLKGYLREDECNMLAFLACIRSDDPSVVYSGYLSVLYYVDNDFYYSVDRDAEIYSSHEPISSRVRADNTYLVPEIKERIEADSPLDTEKVTKTTQTLTDATLKANGVSSGWNNYNEVVKLLLDWYVE